MRVLHCPKGCELHVLSDRSYSSIRLTCRHHLERVHNMTGGALVDSVRAMLGGDYRESPEYELHELPVWPDDITVRSEKVRSWE